MIRIINVNTYIEQIGRRRSIKHYNTLDGLECSYIGPSANIESWIPRIGQPHPDYPAMTVDSVETTDKSGALTELRVSYIGKIYGMNAVAMGSETHYGETSYTTFANYRSWVETSPINQVTDPDTGEITTAAVNGVEAYEFVSYSYAHHYEIQTVTFKTLSQDPSRVLGDIHSGKGKVLNEFIYTTSRNVSSTGSGLVSSSIDFPVQMINRSVNSLNNRWYEISESWGPTPVVATSTFYITTNTVIPAGLG